MRLASAQETFVSIDPGLHSCGWAVFYCHGPVVPLAVGLIHPPGSIADEDFLVRAQNVGGQVDNVVKQYGSREAWIEMPVFFQSAGGMMGMASGSVPKLCACVGAIAGRLSVPAHPVLVPTWKGSLPKAIVTNRIRRILGEDVCRRMGMKKDIFDAVGIGLWRRGKL